MNTEIWVYCRNRWWSSLIGWVATWQSKNTVSRNNGKRILLKQVCFPDSSVSKESACNAGVQFSSVAQSCPTLCDPMNCSTPGLPVWWYTSTPELIQTHIYWVSDAIQPSHPLSSPSPPAPNPSQHQRPFQWVNSLHEVAKVLAMQETLVQFLDWEYPLEKG